MKNKKVKLYILLVFSIIVLSFSLISLKIKLFVDQWITVPYILVGITCGAFGYSLGSIIQDRLLEKNPELERKIRIEKNDERNKTLINSAKSKAFDAMIYIYGVLILILGLLNVDLTIILLLVGAYLTVCGIYVYYMYKLQKEI